MLRGNIRGGGAALASYLLREGVNQGVEVFNIRGTSQPDNLRASLIEMSLTSEISGKTTKGLYQVVINPRPGEDVTMTPEQWFRAAEIIEQKRQLTGHKRVMVKHVIDSRHHMHVTWERYNHDTGLMNSNEFSNTDLIACRRMMELEFGHQPTNAKNQERPALRELLSDLWQQQPDGGAFLSAVQSAGYTIARQTGRRPYVIINSKGRSFELVKEIPNVRTRQVRERLKGLSLPDKNHVIDAIKEKTKTRRKIREQIADELKQHLSRDPQKTKGRGR